MLVVKSEFSDISRPQKKWTVTSGTVLRQSKWQKRINRCRHKSCSMQEKAKTKFKIVSLNAIYACCKFYFFRGGGVIYFVSQFLEKAWPFNKTSFDLLHPTMLSAKCKFGKNWLCGSGEGVIYFVIQSLEKRVTFQLNKLRSPSSKDALCQMQVGKMSSLCFRYFSITLFEKSIVIHLNKLELPLPKDALHLVWLKLAQCFCWTISAEQFSKY